MNTKFCTYPVVSREPEKPLFSEKKKKQNN